MIDQGKTQVDLAKDPEWFSWDEIRKYKLADKVDDAARWKDRFGTSGPIEVKFPTGGTEIGKLAKAYRRKLREFLNESNPEKPGTAKRRKDDTP
jgi:hypothetical protein